MELQSLMARPLFPVFICGGRTQSWYKCNKHFYQRETVEEKQKQWKEGFTCKMHTIYERTYMYARMHICDCLSKNPTCPVVRTQTEIHFIACPAYSYTK